MSEPDGVSAVLGAAIGLLAKLKALAELSTVSERIAFIALLVSGYSAWQSRRSRKVAEESYALARQRSSPLLELYLVDAHIRRRLVESRRIYVFRIRVTNKSDAPNGFKSLTLRIDFHDKGGPPANIVVHHDSALWTAVTSSDSTDPIQVPGAISSRAVVGGVAYFAVSDGVMAGKTVDAYTISLSDSYDDTVVQEAIFLSEVEDEVEGSATRPNTDPSSV